MTDERRDELIARALRDLPVPDHGPTFWDDLDLRLGDPVEPGAARAVPADPGVHRLDTSELPSVTALSDGRRRRSRRTPVLAVAAAVILVIAAVGVVTFLGSDDGDDDGTELADQPNDATTTLADDTGSTAPILTTSTTVTAATESATGTVQTWLQAIGEGDIDTATQLTGPKTVSYATAAMDGVQAFLTESQEGYGAWADVPDATYTEIPLGQVDLAAGQVSIVIVSGANRGEGREEPVSVDAFPVVDSGEGWRVEPLAFSPDRDNAVIVQSPRAPSNQSGLGSMAGDAAVEVIVPAAGTVYFKIDDLDVFSRDTTGVGANDDPYARYDPTGTLPGGSHTLVVVGLGADGTITTIAGPFTVPGGTGSGSTTSTTVRSGGSTGATTSTTRRAGATTTTTRP